MNPLELLHLKEVAAADGPIRNGFRRILLDSPPLLLASDANLLAGLADGTLLVARIGFTTPDSLNRAIGSLGQDSILGIRRQRDFSHSPAIRGSLCGSRPL